MNRMMIAALTAAGMLLAVSIAQASEPPAPSKKVDCRKPLLLPDSKFKDGKKDSKPVPPKDGCNPPPGGKNKNKAQ